MPQGTIGYMIQQTFQNILSQKNINREVVTLVTQVMVDANSPAIKNPTKFVGKRYTDDEAEIMSDSMGCSAQNEVGGLDSKSFKVDFCILKLLEMHYLGLKMPNPVILG